MHSFLVVSKDKEGGFDQIDKILKSEEISQFDKNYFSYELAVGIEDVREVQGKLYLKPFKSKKRAIILDFSNGATIQAQNSMLKILEEPPPSTIILIYATTREDFLPTILSRCKVIDLNLAGPKAINLRGPSLEKLLNAGVGERMEIAAEWGEDRALAIQTVEQALFALEELLKTSDKQDLKKYLSLLKSLNSAYSDLKFSNVSPRFILENYFINL